MNISTVTDDIIQTAMLVEKCPGALLDASNYKCRLRKIGIKGRDLADAMENYRRVAFTIIVQYVAQLSGCSIEIIADCALRGISHIATPDYRGSVNLNRLAA